MATFLFVLTLTLFKANDNGGTSVSRFGPFTTLEACQKAGEQWLTNQVGNATVYGAYAACTKVRANT